MELPNELPPKDKLRIFYQDRAKSLLKQNGIIFDEFLEKHSNLLGLARNGDNLISSKETTGYNLLSSSDNMDILSNKKLLFLNIYSHDPAGVGVLVANLHQDHMITKDQVSLGIKASKVIYGNWTTSPNESIERLFTNSQEGLHNPIVSKTTEIVVTLSVVGSYHANQILNSIYNYSEWDIPDSRATISLVGGLSKRKFTSVQANILNDDKGQLIILRKSTKFSGKWNSDQVLVNTDLAKYLVKYGVRP